MAALYSTTTGSSNMASGYVALYYNTTGSFNLFLGADVTGDGRQHERDPHRSAV